MTSLTARLAPSADLGWDRSRWFNLACVALALGILVIPLLRLWASLHSPASLAVQGVDYALYRDAALRWLHGEGYFLPRQLAGPYVLGHLEVLYPPVALWLFVPFAYLPAFLWYVVPLGLLIFGVARLRPAPWTLPVMAALVAIPPFVDLFWLGQPTIWLPAFVALGVGGGGWAVFVLLKPSLFPFAAIGINRRVWWLTLGVFVALALPFGGLWFDWVTAVRNSNAGPLYSADQIPMMMIGVVAWLGRKRMPAVASSPSGAPEPAA